MKTTRIIFYLPLGIERTEHRNNTENVTTLVMESNDVKRRFSSAPTFSNAVSSRFILSTVTQFDSPSKT